MAAFVRKHFSDIVVGTALVIVFTYSAFVLLGPNRTVYWLYVHSNSLNLVSLACDFTPLVGILLLAIWAIYTLRKRGRIVSVGFFGSLFIYCGLIYFSSYGLAKQTGESGPIHIAEAYWKGAIYRLTFWTCYGCTGGDDYILFRCDRIGFLCENLTSFSPNKIDEITGTLRLEVASDGLQILVRDEERIVYRQSLE